MPSTYAEAYRLADRLETLCEPYRQNAISWLSLCTQTPMDNPRADMLRFLSVLNPIVRETFVLHAGRVLDEAVRYFGVKRGYLPAAADRSSRGPPADGRAAGLIQVFESPEFLLGVSWPYSLYLDWLFTILWVVGITNAFNFVDSMDGLAIGLGGMAAAFFMLVMIGSGQQLLSQQSAIVLGACIGLYYFNSPPARLFLGDSGAQTLGFVLSVLAIAYRPQGANQSSSWVVPIMLLGVPIFDMVLVVVSRLRRGKPIYTAALDHTYHRLVAAGWDSNRAVLTMQVVCTDWASVPRTSSPPALISRRITSGTSKGCGYCIAVC